MKHVCGPCVFVLETEETALRLLDRALELAITALINVALVCFEGPPKLWEDPRCPFNRRKELVELSVSSNRMSAAILDPAGTGRSGLTRQPSNVLPESRYKVRHVKVAKHNMCRDICTTTGARPAGNSRATDQMALKSLEVAHKGKCKVVDSNHVAEARKFLCA